MKSRYDFPTVFFFFFFSFNMEVSIALSNIVGAKKLSTVLYILEGNGNDL